MSSSSWLFFALFTTESGPHRSSISAKYIHLAPCLMRACLMGTPWALRLFDGFMGTPIRLTNSKLSIFACQDRISLGTYM